MDNKNIQARKIREYMLKSFVNGSFFLLISAGSLLSATVFQVLLFLLEDGAEYIDIVRFLYVLFVMCLLMGLILMMSNVTNARKFYLISSVFLSIVLIIYFIPMYTQSVNKSKLFWFFSVLSVLYISCVALYNAYQLIKVSIPKIGEMETKDILTVIIVPILTFLTGLLIR